MQWLQAKSWSPYAVGVGIGVLSWFAFGTAGRGLGITTAFEYAAGLTAGGGAYLADHQPKIDWEWMVVVGVFIGSFVSAKLSGDTKHPTVPALWRRRFGHSTGHRTVFAFAGGLVMMLGARLARGCTSGHGITGALQLAVSSWTFIAVAFVTAIVAALAIYGRPRSLGDE